jgi:hypothetical protein
MKTSFFNKILFYLFISGNLFWISCIDKSVDLDNLSNEMALGGEYYLPGLKESRIDIDKLLARYEPDSTIMVTIGTDENNDICIAYDTVFRYAMNEINYDFDLFSGTMSEEISELFDDTPISNILDGLELFGQEPKATLTSDISVKKEISQEYNINSKLNDRKLETKQNLRHIHFLNTDIVIKVRPSFEIKTDNLLVLKIEIPGIDEPLTVNVEPKPTGLNEDEYKYTANNLNKDFDLLAEGQFKFTFEITGDDQTEVQSNDKIECGIEFRSRDKKPKYVAYGWFNYFYYENPKADTVSVNLSDYIPGAGSTVLTMADPQFTFEINSSLGVPLWFKVDTIQSDIRGSDSEIFTSSNDSSFIKAASKYGAVAKSDPIEINNEYFTKNSNGEKQFSDFIRTDLDALQFIYRFYTDFPEKQTVDNLQFIPSDAMVEVHGHLKVPLAFGEKSILCYTDTIELNLDTESLEDVEKLDLLFSYTNHLPIGFYLDLYLLDEFYENILEENKAYQSIKMRKAKTDTEGIVDESELTEGKFSITFTKDSNTSITQMKKAHYLMFDYRSVESDKDPDQVRLKKGDYLSIKLGIMIDGKIIYKF